MIIYHLYLKNSTKMIGQLETNSPLSIGEKLHLAGTDNQTYKILDIESKFMSTVENGIVKFSPGMAEVKNGSFKISEAYKIAVITKCKPV